jgi:hypothetical protein
MFKKVNGVKHFETEGVEGLRLCNIYYISNLISAQFKSCKYIQSKKKLQI